ncbi:hypothetical protein SAMN05216388_1004291 [Halorientalis persicus]|uniref:CARDB protein n=1 Tax=Halorientalis persicus TaxID=1367881 RepID=A0A1H8IVY8_9EURY|nr:hypothetical protein [Halorientalis persicus]SEN72611.1 hypothetical protein SAMN05216388_1004291 [Halorientalis persicus]
MIAASRRALVVGVVIALVAGTGTVAATTPAATQSDDTQKFEFDLDGNESDGRFQFSGNSNGSVFDFSETRDSPDFSFGETSEPPDFSGIGDDDGSPFDFSGIGDDGEAPDFSGIGDDGEAPDFSGIGDDGEAPDFSGIGDDGEAPDFSGIGDSDDDGDDGQEPGDGDSTEPNAPATFQISNIGTNSPVTEGETLTVDATVENVGDREGTQSVTLSVLDQSSSSDVTLAGGATEEIALSVPTQPGDAGSVTAMVQTVNDSLSTSVQINEADSAANFQLSNLQAPETVQAGETIEGSIDIENIGGREGTQTGGFGVDVDGDGDIETLEERTVTLAPGERTTETLTLPLAESLPGGTVTFGVHTENETVTRQVSVVAADGSTADDLPEYRSFTAYVEEGYIEVGEKDRRGDLPDCPSGIPENETKGCAQFTASFDQTTGEYTVTPENFRFPVIRFESDTLDDMPTNISATTTVEGSLDTATGYSTFEASTFANLLIPEIEGCGMPVVVNGTTGDSGSLSGSNGSTRSVITTGTSNATLVDNEFTVPGARSCDGLETAIGNDVGLPAGAGENEFVMELYIEFHAEPVA